MSPPSGKNPFRPGVGTRPAYLAGRDAPIGRFGAMLRAAPEQAANMRLTGLRGVGKTVLLGEFQRSAVDAGWAAATLEMSPSHNRDAPLIKVLTDVVSGAVDQVSKVERVKSFVGKTARTIGGALKLSYDDVSFSLDTSSEGQDLAKHLMDGVKRVVQHGREGLVLLLDEAQIIRDETSRSGQHPLSLLIAVFAALQRAEPPLPIGLVVCGLPTLTGNLLRARTYTERMFRGEEIGSLKPQEATRAFTVPLESSGIEVAPDLVNAVVEEVEGYPYFIQLWGAELWDAAVSAGVERFEMSLLEATRTDIHRRLDIDFYEPRVATLTPAEQDVLLGTAACPYPPLVSSDLTDSIPKSPGNINVLLGRLVEAGVLYRVRKGQYEYTAPKFREYLQRRVAQEARL